MAARGLDFPDVTLILQYDLPAAPAEYVHRVGRTARMGHAGEAALFLMPHEATYLKVLQQKGITLAHESSTNCLKWLPDVDGGEYGDGAEMAGGRKGARVKGGADGRAMGVAFALQRRIMQVCVVCGLVRVWVVGVCAIHGVLYWTCLVLLSMFLACSTQHAGGQPAPSSAQVCSPKRTIASIYSTSLCSQLTATTRVITKL